MGHRMSIGSEHCGQTNLWITSFACVDFSLDSTYLNLHLGHTTGVSIIASVPYRADEASISTISTATTKLANGTYQRLHESLSAHGGASL